MRHGLPIPANILFKRLKRHLLYKVNRMPILYDYEDEHYGALKQRQQWPSKYGTQKDFATIPVGMTIVVQREDGSPWTHGTVVGHGTKQQNNKSFEIHVIEKGFIIIRIQNSLPQYL